MLVTLAYLFETHPAGETIEVDDEVGQAMIRDGLARLPDEGHVEEVLGGIAELRAYAADHDIDITGLRSKADIAAAIEAAEHDRATTDTPPAGADT